MTEQSSQKKEEPSEWFTNEPTHPADRLAEHGEGQVGMGVAN